ncbi:MAG: LysR family transcriptional regulator [Lachnospiraceae bacterium]|nr:LysR family transcriptional regulator [Lachnospiraceae bacterium]
MEKRFLRAEDVAKELDISTAYAYKVIRQLNDELKEKGFLTISGRVNREYFFKRMYEAGKEDN